jgi:hypothetical protein
MNFIMKFLILFLILSPEVFAEVRLAKIYAIGKTDSPALFNQRTETKEDGSGVTHETALITDLSGVPVLTEESDYRGDQLIHQLVKKLQTQEAYEVVVNAKKVTFRSYRLQDGKLSPKDPEKSEDLTANFITGPVLEPFLRNHWQEVLQGDTVHVRFGVLEISESVGFKFWEYAQTKIGDKPYIQIRMKPSSIFISMAVSSIDLFFDPTQKKLMRYKGRTPLKVQSNGKWVPLDAEIIYQ